jgi:hypothetical protein
MNAPANVTIARPILPVAEILKILAASGAASWTLFPLEKSDVIDPLQWFAERTGLVSTLGQDVVQALIAAPFLKLRGTPQ